VRHIQLIAEVGINHSSSLIAALQLIDMAKECGAEVVKFQKKTPELSTPKSQWNNPRTWDGKDITYLEYKRLMEFGQREYDEIDRYCRSIGIEWTASVWDLPSLEFMSKYDVPWIKIPSAKLTDLDLIRESIKIAPVYASTGMSTLKEIEDAVNLIVHDKNSILMHCHSAYPANNYAELSLPLVQVLAQTFNMPVGYSSHSTSYYPALYAAVLGAVAIEAHITLGRHLPGTDQSSSLEKRGLETLGRELNLIPLVMSNDEKIVWESELPARLKLRGV